MGGTSPYQSGFAVASFPGSAWERTAFEAPPRGQSVPFAERNLDRSLSPRADRTASAARAGVQASACASGDGWQSWFPVECAVQNSEPLPASTGWVALSSHSGLSLIHISEPT